MILVATQTPKDKTGWALGALSAGIMAGNLPGRAAVWRCTAAAGSAFAPRSGFAGGVDLPDIPRHNLSDPRGAQAAQAHEGRENAIHLGRNPR